MTLQNLLKIGQLKAHETDGAEIQRLLTSAARALEDSRVQGISPESRFSAGYRAIMQAALAALMANGFRPNTNKPGHHMTVLQSLPTTIGLDNSRLAVLDALRRKRNLNDYTGAENYLATYDGGKWVDVDVSGDDFWMPTGYICEWDR